MIKMALNAKSILEVTHFNLRQQAIYVGIFSIFKLKKRALKSSDRYPVRTVMQSS